MILISEQESILIGNLYFNEMAYQLASAYVTLPCYEGFNSFAVWPAPHLVSML